MSAYPDPHVGTDLDRFYKAIVGPDVRKLRRKYRDADIDGGLDVPAGSCLTPAEFFERYPNGLVA